ncbi:MAG: MBL fold metallo-hydrolase [Bacilli bacterium]|nr:MBL fold metallo-hydrolase [Bacilli bacterium]
MKAFFLLLGLILGFVLGLLIVLSDYLLVIASVLIMFFSLLFAYSKKQVPIFLVGLAMGFMLGFIQLPIESGKREVSGMVIKTGENYYVVFAEFRRYYVYEKGHGKELGDIISYSCSISKYITANYESKFDFGRYLNENGVFGQLNPYKETYVFSSPIRLRAYEDWFCSSLDEKARGLVYACLFNRKDYQNEFVALASSLNLIFAVSSSGLLYGWLLKGIEKRLKWRLEDKKAELIVFALSFLFLIPGHSKIGIKRVFLSRGLHLFNRYGLHKGLDSITVTSLSGILIIMLNPYDALSSALWIGIGVSLAFQFSVRYLKKNFKNLKRTFASFILLRLFLLPLTLAYNEGELPILSGLYSQFLLPITFLFQLIGYVCMLLPFIRVILNPLGEGYYGLLSLLSYINPKIHFPPPTPIFYILYYLLLIVLLLMVEVGLRKTPLILASTGVLTYLGSLLPFPIWFTDQVSFINVGQGDSILIRDNDNVVLLDTGGSIRFDMAKEVLIPYFRKQRIGHIDYLIASHGDFDHIGAKDSLMENFEVRHFLSVHNDFPLEVGELEFLSYNNIEDSDDENEKSLVLSLDFIGKKWIFTGDAPLEVEKEIVKNHPELDCDILKVGHHGSDTSTCKEWLEAITPSEAIISCGRNNSYGHPTAKVIDLLNRYKINIRRTDVEGTITYRTFSLLSL